MSLFKVFDVAGSAMTAQSLRLNMTASNLANAETMAGTPEAAYKARHPVFSATLQAVRGNDGNTVGVRVRDVIESEAPNKALHMPDHPEADENGYVYRSNVNTVEELVNMISASRSYQNNVEVMTTSRDLLLQTLQLGR
ncbi:flagellar basal-body rod protein FlgC [Natronocella acetinitrilica]|uniref:Flagellar basal-body rod protein FlgC n=1 Tax=Natronocella acetinitrilica TaxID=414046 RepID=A0AAE3G5R3_9GAMM|nr:flagellar basal body rod protein FlgC [Natronocella acetinitrilica]MCP1675623.1 flagellar basal-body rod protein FlgC [Natronocella acetinitrilica]